MHGNDYHIKMIHLDTELSWWSKYVSCYYPLDKHSANWALQGENNVVIRWISNLFYFIQHLGYLFWLFGVFVCNLGDVGSNKQCILNLRYFRGNKIPFTFCLYSRQLRLFVDLCSLCVVASEQYYSNEMRDYKYTK